MKTGDTDTEAGRVVMPSHTDLIFKNLFLKLSSFLLLQLGEFMYSFRLVISLLNLTLFSLLIIAFTVTTQGTLPFVGYLVAGQKFFNTLSFEIKNTPILMPLQGTLKYFF